MGAIRDEWEDTPGAEFMSPAEVDRRLGMLRESCLFYLKLDFALFAALGAFVSYIGWRDFELLAALNEYRHLLHGLMFLVIGGLLLEWRLSRSRFLSRLTAANPDPALVLRGLKLFRWGYLVQVWGHLTLVLFCSGYLFGAANIAAELLSKG